VPAGAKVRYRGTLLTARAGVTYGVLGEPVQVTTGPSATDEEAGVELGTTAGYAAGTNPALTFGFDLPAGDYALVAEAFTTTDGATIGQPWAVYFSVGAPGAPPTTAPQ